MTTSSTPFSDPLCPIFVDDAEALAEWEKILAEIRESAQEEAVIQQPIVDHIETMLD
jgi:hypothetical protein